ncbi:MAG: acetylglutamate kinase [Planctomycetota bacterium]|nr:acetylglutamate kinase [Planctomycetota bacterium]
MIDLVSASDHVRLHRGQVIVIKVGGACLARPALLEALARQIAVVEACGARLVVVHGAGPQTDDVQRALGEEPRKVGGRRITTPRALEALIRATRGELAPALVEALVAAGARAEVLCAEDCVVATRRRPVVPPPTSPLMSGDGPIDFGLVGDIRSVDPTPIRARLAAGVVPVLSPPVADDAGGRGGRLNVNADLMAAHVAVALGARMLVLVTSVAGVLTDPADRGSVVSSLALDQLAELERGGALAGGMHVKASAARLALEGGVPRVHVVSGTEPEALLGELYTTQGTGTVLTAEPEVVPA